MRVKMTKTAAVHLPLTALRCLYQSRRGKTVVCEIDIAALKKVNDVVTVEEMVAQARLEYASGQTARFTNPADVIAYLRK